MHSKIIFKWSILSLADLVKSQIEIYIYVYWRIMPFIYIFVGRYKKCTYSHSTTGFMTHFVYLYPEIGTSVYRASYLCTLNMFLIYITGRWNGVMAIVILYSACCDCYWHLISNIYISGVARYVGFWCQSRLAPKRYTVRSTSLDVIYTFKHPCECGVWYLNRSCLP